MNRILTPESAQNVDEEGRGDVLVLGCGALAKELVALIRANQLEDKIVLSCLPAELHNYPDKIAPLLDEKLQKSQGRFEKIYIAYADCGTGGHIDRVIEKYGAERLAGPHCYATYRGQSAFQELAQAELGTFYLTDYLALFFDRLIIKGFKLDRYPQLKDQIFGHYHRLVYLAQVEDKELDQKAEAAAAFLELSYEKIFCGYGELAEFIRQAGNQAGKQAC